MPQELHGPRPVKEVGRAAGEAWNAMSQEQRAPYEERSMESRKEYRVRKQAADAVLEQLSDFVEVGPPSYNSPEKG